MSRFDSLSGRGTHADKLRGIYVGIVTANKDQGNDSRYRVKLRFPWLSADSNDSSAWARIAVPMAGAGRGTYLLPEVGAQVLIIFEHGNIGSPIVIGSLWSQTERPPERNADGKNNLRVIKSRSGHRLIFDDTEGAERVILCDSTSKNTILIDSASNTLTLQSQDGDIELQAPSGAVRLHGKNVNITTTGKLQGRGGTKLLITTRGSLNIRASGVLKLQGTNTQLNPGGASSVGPGQRAAPASGAPGQQGRGAGGAGGSGGGTSGGAGSGGAAAQTGGGAAASQQPASALSWVELELVEARGQTETPAAGVRYRVRTSDGRTVEGTLDAQGRARVEGIAPGTCQVSFPDLGSDWQPA